MNENANVNPHNGIPAFPAAFAKVLSVLRDNSTSANDLAAVIRLDGAISSRVLRLANSASLGLPQSVSSVSLAIVLLGRKRLTSLLLGYAAVFAVHGTRTAIACNIRRYWRHALMCAHLSESLAKSMHRSIILDSDEAFTSGLLHDIGKLMRLSTEPVSQEDASKQTVWVEHAGTHVPDHCNVGYNVVTDWLFPTSLAEAILLHHPSSSNKLVAVLPVLVHVADCMTHGLGYSLFENDATPKLHPSSIDFLSVSLERLKVLASDALTLAEETEATIDAVM